MMLKIGLKLPTFVKRSICVKSALFGGINGPEKLTLKNINAAPQCLRFFYHDEYI